MTINITPVGWRLLIRQPTPPKKTKGGLILTKQSQDVHESNMTKGQVVALGPLCYQGEKFTNGYGENTTWALPGDYVLYSKHVGSTFTVLEGEDEIKYRFINDTDVLAVFGSESDMKALKGLVYEGDE